MSLFEFLPYGFFCSVFGVKGVKILKHKKLILATSVLLVLMMVPFITTLAAEDEGIALNPELSFMVSTTNFYNSEYDLNHYLIGSDHKTLDMGFIDGITATKTDAYVNLADGYTVVESDDYFTQLQSSTLINNTWNAGTVSSAATVYEVTSELVSASKSTIATGSATTNDTGGYVTWDQNLWYDYDDDDVEDTGEMYYDQVDYQVVLYSNFKYYQNATDATGYGAIQWVFETTGSDYTIEVILQEATGAIAWSNVDASGENKATITYGECNGTSIATFLPVDEVLAIDLGDDPDIKGLKSVTAKVFGGADKLHTIEIYNAAVFTKKPALGDRGDDDGDYDIDALIFGTWMWDDNEFLATKCTATDTYTNELPLRNPVADEYTTLVQFRKLRITGTYSLDPTTYATTSTESGSNFETRHDMWFVTTGLADYFTGVTTSNYFSFTDVYFNVTVDDAYLPGSYQDFEDKLILFEVDGIDKTENWRSDWDVTADGTEIYFDMTNPDADTGSQQEVDLVFLTLEDESGTGGVDVTAEEADNTILFIVLICAGTIIVGYVIYRATRKKKGKRR